MQGIVALVHPSGQYGFIRPDGARGQVFVHLKAFQDANAVLVVDDRLEFDAVPQEGHEWPAAANVRRLSSAGSTPDATNKSCFVVMPIGRSDEEKEHFSGWYQVTIEPAIVEAGLVPILSAANEQPNAINDEIRAHLALDPMVVVDLGGLTRDSEPNPNVMYELGIRHAFNLPHVIMAWEGQRLPFDIANQRVLMEGRKMKDVVTTRTRLSAFIREALAGNHYRPMDAVGRIATLSRAESQLGERSILRALVQEVRELRTPPAFRKPHVRGKNRMKAFLGEAKVDRRPVLNAFRAAGGTVEQWGKFLDQPVPQELDQSLSREQIAAKVALDVYGLDISSHLGSSTEGSLPQAGSGAIEVDVPPREPTAPTADEAQPNQDLAEFRER